jgi:hypothetical protein
MVKYVRIWAAKKLGLDLHSTLHYPWANHLPLHFANGHVIVHASYKAED